MAHLEVATFIAAPPETVWEILADLERQGDWMVDVRELRVTSDVKRGEGAVMEVTSELFGLPIVKDVMQVTAWQPGRRIDVAHRGSFAGTGEFVLYRAENGTIFRWIEDVQPPLGPLGAAAFALLVKPHLTRVFARSLANVKRMAEARAGVGSLA